MGCTQSSGAAELQNDELVAICLEPPNQEAFTNSEPSFKFATPPPPTPKTQRGSKPGAQQNTYKPPASSDQLANRPKPVVASASAEKPARSSASEKPAPTSASKKSPRTSAKKEGRTSRPAQKQLQISAKSPPRKPKPNTAPNKAAIAPNRIDRAPNRPDFPQRKVREDSAYVEEAYVEEAKEGQTFDEVYSAGRDVSVQSRTNR